MNAPPHVSSLKLEALAMGALPPPERATTQAHLDTCLACRARSEELASHRRHFTAHVLPRAQLPSPRVAPWGDWRWWAPALALASAVVLLFALVAVPSPQEPELAVKGGAMLQLFAHRGERTWKVEEGEALAPGDQVRFVVEGLGLPYVLVVSVDGAGQVNTYYPFGGHESVQVPSRGLPVEIPGSVVLDNAPGPERLFALFSRQPLSFESVAPALRELSTGGAEVIRDRRRLPVAAGAQATFLFEKTQP
ncbi:DUF4384 domain-containing protein [Myxococcus guangdongensis]|uniref:DUF4384 domain-containing protein n=1 Tax=Myxococcus guangdongensis TaxID=2906760 RepID=UPI00225E4985|nr:DUF4384 domain-containing protein [Myxococcus guangdongensis]